MRAAVASCSRFAAAPGGAAFAPGDAASAGAASAPAWATTKRIAGSRYERLAQRAAAGGIGDRCGPGTLPFHVFFHLGGGGDVAFCWLARSPRTSWGNGGLPRPCWGQAVGLQRAMFRVISGAGCLVHAKSGAIWCGPPLRETIVFSQLTGRPAQTLREPLVAAAQRAIHGLQAIEASRGRSSAVARGDARPWEVIAPAFPRPCP